MTRVNKPTHRKLSKEQAERRTFEVLAATLGWAIEVGSIQQPPPDHPDIRCVIVDAGPLAIELVAIDARETRLRLNNMFGTPYAWELALTWWPEADRNKLQADLRNAHVSVHIGNDAGTRDRAKLLTGFSPFCWLTREFLGISRRRISNIHRASTEPALDASTASPTAHKSHRLPETTCGHRRSGKSLQSFATNRTTLPAHQWSCLPTLRTTNPTARSAGWKPSSQPSRSTYPNLSLDGPICFTSDSSSTFGHPFPA